MLVETRRMASDIIKQTYDILFKQLEADSYGNNKYFPKEKFDELLNEIKNHVSCSYKLGFVNGKKQAANDFLTVLSNTYNKTIEECQQDQNVKKDRT